MEMTTGDATSQGPRISFLNPWAHINICGIANVINNKTIPEKMACSFEMRSANATVMIATPIVARIFSFGRDLGVLLRSIGICPNTRTDSRINEKTEDGLGNREASTTEADNAALMESTDVKRSEEEVRLLSPT